LRAPSQQRYQQRYWFGTRSLHSIGWRKEGTGRHSYVAGICPHQHANFTSTISQLILFLLLAEFQRQPKLLWASLNGLPLAPDPFLRRRELRF
jgi:hypothetical protein